MADTNFKTLSPRRNTCIERPKLYEEMLLKEISGNRRTNEPMHAVLEAELGESGMEGGNEAQHIRNHALIHYLATLANSNSANDTIDFDFVQSLLGNGADINSTDKTGQTFFHEVARSWNTDVVTFLLNNGADINQKDHFGRSPLHVAAAVDYADMVEFLLQNGADINIRTNEEEQTPIHFAAKSNAVNSLQMLLAYGADIDSRDSNNRTPLQVSAQMNRSKAAKHLINEGAPAGVCDDVGNSALSLLIEKIPEVALEAMDQFHSSDIITRKNFYFLNYLEASKLKEESTPARTPLEIAVQNKRFDIILHPVMQRLIGVKWKMYGKWGAIQELVLNLVYTILWSVVGVTLPKTGRELYEPLEKHIWRLVIGILLILLTIWEIKMQAMNTIKTRQEFVTWREWRANELERDFKYCHPRWPQETEYLESEIKGVRQLSFITDSDGWMYFDWVALVLILGTIVSHMTFFHFSTNTSKEVHQYIIILLLLILWIRIFKYARPFEGAGPFVVIFGSVFGDIMKWAFLNLVILIPYTCAFYIIFGAYSLHPVESYSNFSPLLHNMFSMMVVNNIDYDKLETANPTMARLLNGTFTLIAGIVTVNLLIALLSNTFERHYENAVANAVMQRARTILLLQKSLGKKKKTSYYDFIRVHGSPEMIRNDLGRFSGTDTDERATIEQVREDVKMIMNFLAERLGKRFGKSGKKSDMEFVKMDVCKLRVCQEDLLSNMKNMKIALNATKEMVEFLKNHNNTTDNNANNNNENNENSNDINNSSKTTNALSERATSSAVTNARLQEKVSTAKTKLYHKRKNSVEEKDSETEASSTTQTSSIENDPKKNQRKKSSKKQEQAERHPKKEKYKENNYNDDDQTSAWELKKELGDYSGYGEKWKPASQEFWNNNGDQSNINSLNTPSRFTQASSSLPPWQRNQIEPDGRGNQREHHRHQYPQIHSSEFRQQVAKRSNELEFSNPLYVTNTGYNGGEENSNFRSSSYYIGGEPTSLKGGRLEDSRVHQPVFPHVDDAMTYARNEFQPGQNDQRSLTGQNFERPVRGVENSGYEQDEWRNRYSNEFSSYGERPLFQQQSGYTNYRTAPVFRGDVSPEQSINNHRPYLSITEQELQGYSPRSANTYLTETHQQSGQSQTRVPAQYPSYHGRDTLSTDYNLSQKIHSEIPPERQQLHLHLSRQTTQGDHRISPMLSESPEKRDFNVINARESSEGTIDVTQMGEPRGMVSLSREPSLIVPDVAMKQVDPSVIVQREIDPSSGLRRTPSFVQNQVVEIENATSPMERIRTVRSRSFRTASPEIKALEKHYSFDSKRKDFLRVSYKASSRAELRSHNQFQDQIGSGVHGQTIPSTFSPYPVISSRKPEISAQYPDISGEIPYVPATKAKISLQYPDISAEYPGKTAEYPSMYTKSGKDSSRSSTQVAAKTTQDEMNEKEIRKKISGATIIARNNSKRMSAGQARESQNDTDTRKVVEPSPEHKNVDKTTKEEMNEEGIDEKNEPTSKAINDDKKISTGESIESKNDTDTEESIEHELKVVDKTTQNRMIEEGIEESRSEASSSVGDDNEEMSADEARESQNGTGKETIETIPKHKEDSSEK